MTEMMKDVQELDPEVKKKREKYFVQLAKKIEKRKKIKSRGTSKRYASLKLKGNERTIVHSTIFKKEANGPPIIPFTIDVQRHFPTEMEPEYSFLWSLNCILGGLYFSSIAMLGDHIRGNKRQQLLFGDARLLRRGFLGNGTDNISFPRLLYVHQDMMVLGLETVLAYSNKMKRQFKSQILTAFALESLNVSRIVVMV